MTEKIISLETERLCLASLIKYNSKISDVMAFIKPGTFHFPIHGTIFSLITATYQEKGSVDQVLLVTKLRQLGVNAVEDIDIYRYIEILYNIPCNPDNIIEYFKELVKFSYLRQTYQALNNTQKFIRSNLSKPLHEIASEISKLLTDTSGVVTDEEREVDLYGEMESELSRRATEQIEPALLTTFPVFDKWYGGINLGDAYVFAAPAKKGKSTFLNYVSYLIAGHVPNNTKVLYLDTEMESWRVQCRAASSLTEINEWHFRTGKFVNKPAMVKKANEMFEALKPIKGKIWHRYVGNKPMDEVLSICRRWYVKNIKKGERALIAFDYIKLDSGTRPTEAWKEYQIVGEKTDQLKKFASSLPDLAVITAIQTNANCDIAMSQQLKWFASNVYILQPKDLEQIQEDGTEFGTHKLVEVVTRYQGEEAHGMNNILKYENQDGRIEYRQNFINFDFSYFKVSEKGTYENIINRRAGQLSPEKVSNEDIDY